MRLKENILNKLRPQLVGLLDSFLMPEHLIRSALAHGDPYQVIFNLYRIILSWHENVNSTTKFHNLPSPLRKIFKGSSENINNQSYDLNNKDIFDLETKY